MEELRKKKWTGWGCHEHLYTRFFHSITKAKARTFSGNQEIQNYENLRKEIGRSSSPIVGLSGERQHWFLNFSIKIKKWKEKKMPLSIYDLETALKEVDIPSDKLPGILHLIDNCKRNRRKFLETERLAKILLNRKMVFIGILSPVEGKLLEANDFSLKQIGAKIEDVRGKPFWQTPWWAHSEDSQKIIREFIERATKGESCTTELSHYSKRGTLNVIEFRLEPSFNETGKVSLLIAEGIDITERKKTEEERIRAQKTESLEILVGGIGHDFNNMLAGIMGFAEILKMEPGNTEYINNIINGSIRAAELVKQLRVFAKTEKLKMEPCSMPEIIKEATSFSLTKGTLAKSSLSIDEDLPLVLGSHTQLVQVFNNLLINALQAMQGKGEISILAQKISLSNNNAYQIKGGAYIKVSVSDIGFGISKENVEKIFDPYYTTKEKSSNRGAGLGLAIVHSIVKNHGGHVTVESKIDQGTTFHVFLPAIESGSLENKNQPNRIEAIPENLKVLILDDEPDIVLIVEKMLKSFDYETVSTNTCAMAKEEFQIAQNSGNPFDLAILDISLPGEIGGIKVGKKFKEQNPKVKIIVASGHAGDQTNNIEFFLQKPYARKDLQKIIQRAFEEK